MIDLFEKLEKKITRKFTKKQRRLWEVFLFITKFSFFAFFLQILMLERFEFSYLVSITSIITYYVLNVFSDGFSLISNTILFEGPNGTVMINVIKDCTGWKSFMALCGLIFAVRKVGITWRKRVVGVIVGGIVIYIGNIVRLTTTIGYAYLYGMENFVFLHDMLWQFGLIILVISIWYIWLKWCERKSHGRKKI